MDLVVGAAVPPLFKCPISLELMRDPVVLSTGQSYERSSIEPWLEAGNHTCPATMQKLSSLELVPNHTLRRLIQNWCEAHGSALGMAPIPTPKLPLTADTMAAILEELLVQTSCTSRQQLMDPLPILKNMRSLARESERNRKCMEDSDAVSVLASMITTSAAAAAAVAVEELPMPLPVPAPLQEGGGAATTGLDLVLYHRKLEAACEEALAVLALLDVQGAAANSTRSNRPRSELLTPRSVRAIAWFLCKGRSLEAKVNAATILAGIMAAAAPSTEADQRRECSSHGNNNNNLGVQIPPGVLEALTKLLREDLYPKAIRASLKAMLTLCIAARRNRIKLVEVGVVPLLIELLPDAAAAAASGRGPRRSSNSNKNSKSSSSSSSSNAVQELALGVLELVCSTAEGRAAVADHALAMAALVHHLHTVSSLATELSVAILWWVCSKAGAGASSSSSSSSDCLLAAQQSGAFAALLLLLQLDCSPGTRVKARELLKLLQQTSWNYYHSHHSTTSAQKTTTTTPTILCDLSSQLGTITGPYLIHN
ncbi:unnamed protein product [Sphagnum tenellum]